MHWRLVPDDTLQLSHINSNWEAVYQNLRKEQRQWGLIVRVLEKTGETVQSRGIMYKAVTQSVLLYVSESWVVTAEILKFLEGLYHRAERQITGITETHGAGRGWEYPPGGGGNGIHGNSSHRRVHQKAAGDHSGKGGLPPHL